MKDKLIVIATIQYTIDALQAVLIDAGRGQGSIEKRGVAKAFGAMQVQFYHAITGNDWTGSVKELQEWLLRYLKDQADALGGHSQITLN